MSTKKKAVKKAKNFGIFFKLDGKWQRSEDYPKSYSTEAAAQSALYGHESQAIGGGFLSSNRFVKALSLILLALSLWTLPARAQNPSNPTDPLAAPQTEAQPKVAFRLSYQMNADDKAGAAFQTALNASIARDASAVEVRPGAAGLDDPTILEIHILATASSDTRTTIVIEFLTHTKGSETLSYVGTFAGQMDIADAPDAAGTVLNMILEQALSLEQSQEPETPTLAPMASTDKA